MSRDYHTSVSLRFFILIIIGLCQIQAKQVVLFDSTDYKSYGDVYKGVLHGRWMTYYDVKRVVYFSCLISNDSNYKLESFLQLGYINKEYSDQIHLELEYYLVNCPNCVQHFSVGKYDTDNADSKPKLNITQNGEDNTYKLIKTIEAKNITYNKKDYKINYMNISFQVNKQGTKLVFLEDKACISLKKVKIYSNICDAYIKDKMILPIVGINNKKKNARITAKCIKNSESNNVFNPKFICEQGDWSHIIGACICSPGFTNISNTCSECPVDTYKFEKGDFACRTCPARSSTRTLIGNSTCQCDDGYARLSNELPSDSCSGPPSAVRSIRLSHTLYNAVNITWSMPNSLGFRSSDEIVYEIMCTLGCDQGNLMYRPSQTKIITPSVFINGMSESAEYKFTIRVHNNMGYSINDSTVIIKKHKPQNPVTDNKQVTNIKVLDVTDNLIHLKWDGPSNITDFKRYDIWYYENEDSMIKTSSKMNHLKISGLNSNSVYHFKIRSVFFLAESSETFGVFTESMIIKTNKYVSDSINNEVTSEMNNNDLTQSTNNAIIAGAICAIIFCIIIVIIMAVLLIKRKKRYSRDKDAPDTIDQYKTVTCARFVDGTPLNNAVNLPLCNTSNNIEYYSRRERKQGFKTYIDPHTYEDVNKAVSEFTNEISLSRIDIESLIGTGEFGQVYKGNLTRAAGNKCQVAIKTLKDETSKLCKLEFLTEASCMGQFDHENVIFLEGVVLKSNPVMIITEYMENGSLDRYLRDNDDGSLSHIQLVQMLRGISDGMKYLSDMSYVHRDLAARNILVNKNLICKVSDFGLSRECNDGSYTTKGGKIPVRWTAPEAISFRKFTSASDIWSFGIVMWEVLSFGERPYWDWSNQIVINEIDKGYRLTPPMDCPEIIYNMMMQCWSKDRHNRPKFSMLYQQLDNICQNTNLLEAIASHKTIMKGFDPTTPIMNWLNSIDLQQYSHHFQQAGYSHIGQLKAISSSQMAQIGITLLGDRKRMMMSLEKILSISHKHEDSGAGSTLSSRECSPTRFESQQQINNQIQPSLIV